MEPDSSLQRSQLPTISSEVFVNG